MLKRLVRAAARRHGVTACFMAKPIEKYAGSGMHFHVSLSDAEGRNVFSESKEGEVVASLLHALGGLVARPWPNRCWCLRRTPIPGAASCRNPMRRSRRPGASTTVRSRCACRQATQKTAASSTGRPASTPIPTWSPRRCWPASPRASTNSSTRVRKPPATAMRAARRRAATCRPIGAPRSRTPRPRCFCRQALGDDLHKTFTEIKHAEYLRVARTVSELDYHLYLHEV